jgi:RHS repeat-associated protein
MSITIRINWYNKLIMKRLLYFRKQMLYAAILLMSLSMYNSTFGQTVIHPFGSFCVGTMNVFSYTGPGTVSSWSVGGNGTILSNSGSSIQVQWNSPVGNTYVTANYTGGSASYNNITISASVTPSVTITANKNNICSGASVIFTAVPVNGGITPNYNWYIDGIFITGGTVNSFTTASLTNGQQVTCVMNTSEPCYTIYSVTSNAIAMTVNALQSMGVTISGTTSVCQTSPASFTASVTNATGNLTYQWKKNGINISTDFAGPPPSVLILNSVNNNDIITCVVSTDGCANPATSNALTISIITPQTFSISPSPSGINFCEGNAITFTAASSHAAYNYQWYINGSAVPGANGSTFTTTASSVTQLQSVTVSANTSVVCVNNTTATGSAQYFPFIVNPAIVPAVTITVPPVVILGSAATFTANPVNGGNTPTYQWQLNGINVPGATGSTYTATITSGSEYQTIGVIMNSNATCAVNPATIANTVKINSSSWENLNYVRVHAIAIMGIDTWTQADQLPIGDKFQSTTYVDGLGRAIQSVDKEVTPGANNTWNDLVKHIEYDAAGRTTKDFLTYPTTEFAGKFKTNAATVQPAIIQSIFNEPATAPTYSLTEYDNSPLNRIVNVKKPGNAWAAGNGNTAAYDINTLADNVQIFTVDYIQGNPPEHKGVYPAGTLYKLTYKDENQKQIVEFTDKSGQMILKKVQLDDVPANEYTGWICTYSVYDDFGLLRYQIQPEGVKYLAANSWSFAGANGLLILNEQCFQYNYDNKGRSIWKKAPGAQPLQMLYDIRDRVVFMQDGNQASPSPSQGGVPQWTANIYDEWDRPVITTLYNTAKTVAQLQTDINAAVTGPVTTTNPGQSIDILTVNLRQAGITSYKATNTVYLVADAGGEFESLPGDEFTAEIDPYAANAPSSITATVLKNPIPAADLNNPAVCTVLQYGFYDNYSFAQVKSFDNNFTNTTAYSTADPNVQTIAKSNRTTGMPTGGLTRVLGTNTFLAATQYYDETGSLIQTQEDNIKSGNDITTLQYHFDGRMLSSCNSHTAAGGGYENFKTLTKYIFDKSGNVTSTQKQFGTNAFKTISSYDYDELGRVKTKHLDPGYTAGGNADLESLNYSYNILNQLTGINKDYALKTPGNYNKWGHFFGMYLGFDNSDNLFANANMLGQVTGQLWSTQGDDAQRKYDYTYDNAGRLTKAAFNEKQHTGDTWSNTQMDFSVSGTNGKITYDLNGNLLNMLQKGVLPGAAAPITVDNLSYTYASLSNKLQSVTDNMTNTTANGSFGDFKDGTNGVVPDYVYDANGNVVIDLNKNAKDLANVAGANGIKYNYLDKPEEIRIAGKGIIKIVYTADGEKLQRKFTSETEDKIKITTYINQYIYEETTTISGTVLSPLGVGGINFEEGRIRIITPTSQGNGLDALAVDGNMDLPGGKRGAYDYFIMDYQQNVRMILTEEIHSASNTATMETNRSVLEESIFGQTGGANEVAATRYPTASTSWTANTTGSVSRVGTLSGHNIGPNTLQKVMAGDKVSASVQYYYQAAPGGNNTNFVNTVLNSLTTAISGGNAAGSIVKGNAAQVSTRLSGMGGFINAVQPNGSNPGGTTPQAFLTILFFDERFNLISAADGGVWQQQVSSSFVPLTLPNIKAPKNGYVYIYVSNQSNSDVYFDNLAVGIIQGNIAEENHYYAYGLKIATLSSRKSGGVYNGTLKNNYLYNGKELFDDADLNWYDYGFRNYDPQIGRFTQLDPLTHEYPFLTPYQYASCDPITNIDVDGLEGTPAPPIGSIYNGGIVTAASYMPEFLSWPTLRWDKIKSGNLVNINLHNVVESTNQSPGIPPHFIEVQVPWQEPGFKQGYGPPAPENEEFDIDKMYERYEKYEARILARIKQENIEKVENAFGSNWYLVGNFLKAGRYEIQYGYHRESLGAAKGLGVEVGTYIVAGKVIGAGIKYAAGAAKGVTYTKSSLALGREVHAGYKLAEHAPALGRFKEFTGIKGIRPDFVDFGTKTIFELKPFNPRGIQLGTKQLNNYKSLFEQNYGGTWKTVLDHY